MASTAAEQYSVAEPRRVTPRHPVLSLFSEGRSAIVRVILGGFLPTSLLVYWWYRAEFGDLNTLIYSSPGIIFRLAVDMWSQGALQEHLLISLQRVLLGFFIGSAIAIILGVLTGFFPTLEKILDPTIQIFRATPTVALLPLFVVWFGFGEFSRILLIVLGILPRTYVITYTGVVNVDKKMLEVARVYQLSRFQTITQVVIPLAAPFIFNALRLAAVSSFLLLVVAEALNARSGLGFLASQAMFNLRVDLILLVAIIYAVLGLLADCAVRVTEKLVTPWNGKKGVR